MNSNYKEEIKELRSETKQWQKKYNFIETELEKEKEKSKKLDGKKKNLKKTYPINSVKS